MRRQRSLMYAAGSLCLLGMGTLAGLGAARQRPAPGVVSGPAEASRPAAPPTEAGGTLLDEVGRIASVVPAQQRAVWKSSLHACRASRVRGAWLHLWMGETALGQEQQPELALWHFREARRLAGAAQDARLEALAPEEERGRDARPGRRGAGESFAAAGESARRCEGLAAYDAALARFYAGEYQEAAAAFHHLLSARPAEVGFERRRAALWYRHAAACAGYHAERARLGIPEPARLDPECGAAGLAVCLRGLGLPCDRKRVLAACRVGGEGSSLQDLVDACPKLGVVGRAVTADEAGLKALPKPLIAYVEHDHFVGVVRADARGVSYVCSDCGCWPGGRVDLNWEQWRALEAGLYLSVVRAGGAADRALARLPAAPGRGARTSADAPHPLRLAAAGPLSRLHLWGLAQSQTLLTLLRGHVFAYTGVSGAACGTKPSALACSPTVACPMDGGAACGGTGPSAGDPVNLATGEEEYSPTPDLTVYNPNGPSGTWSHSYRSLRVADPSYEMDDMGLGWTQPYNVSVVDASYGMDTQVPAGSTGATVVPGTGQDAPAGGASWDIVLNGSVIASSASPAGWTVTYQQPNFSVLAPGGASSATNYEARYQEAGGATHSGIFDVVPFGSYPQGTDQTLGPNGGDGPAGGATWDVTLNGTVIGSSAQPNGWGASYYIPNNWIIVQIPLSAATGSGYEVRVTGGGPPHSATFTVIASRYSLQPGAKYVQFSDGSRIKFTAPRVPTATQPSVACAADPGAPLSVTWYYDSTDIYGHYAITFADRSQWVTTTAGKWYNPGTGLTSTLYYPLSQIVDRMGHAINFNYGAAGPSGFPLLASITDATSGTALLTLTRATDGSGNLLSVSDPYGRSVYYQVGTYPTQNVALGLPQSYQGLHLVSEIVPTGTVNPAE